MYQKHDIYPQLKQTFQERFEAVASDTFFIEVTQKGADKGNPYDNAVKESFYKSFEREIMPVKPYKTKSQALFEILEHLENYDNIKRIHGEFTQAVDLVLKS